MRDAAEWCWLLVAHECGVMLIFGPRGWLKVWHWHEQIWIQSHDICGHETISAASRPLNIIHMGLMKDAAVWCWLLVSQGSRVVLIFGLRLAESLAIIIATLDQKSWHLWLSNHISCLQTLEYHPYGSDERCCRVVLAPGGSRVLGIANLLTSAGG
jgi:hypothetical protein